MWHSCRESSGARLAEVIPHNRWTWNNPDEKHLLLMEERRESCVILTSPRATGFPKASRIGCYRFLFDREIVGPMGILLAGH